MRAGVLNAGIFGIAARVNPAVKEQESREVERPAISNWSEEAFARQQIRNLVRQVFSTAGKAAHHVVFSGVELDSGVNDICWRVGQTLACEKPETVLLVVSDPRGEGEANANSRVDLRSRAKQVDRNLWRLSIPTVQGRSEMDIDSLRTLMAEVRREFEYSVIADSVAGWISRTSLAEAADGIVLVLSALRTRRASARRLLDDLAHVRLLGTVLQDREFPIPEGIYHRL